MARLPSPNYFTAFGDSGFFGTFETEGMRGAFASVLENRANAGYNSIGMQPPVGPSGGTGGGVLGDGGGSGGGGTGGSGEDGGGGAGGVGGGSGSGVAGGQNPAGGFPADPPGPGEQTFCCNRPKSCQSGAWGGSGTGLASNFMSACDLNSCMPCNEFERRKKKVCVVCWLGRWLEILS